MDLYSSSREEKSRYHDASSLARFCQGTLHSVHRIPGVTVPTNGKLCIFTWFLIHRRSETLLHVARSVAAQYADGPPVELVFEHVYPLVRSQKKQLDRLLDANRASPGIVLLTLLEKNDMVGRLEAKCQQRHYPAFDHRPGVMQLSGLFSAPPQRDGSARAHPEWEYSNVSSENYTR